MTFLIEAGDIVFLQGMASRSLVKAVVSRAEAVERLGAPGQPAPIQYQAEVLSGSDPLLPLLKGPIVVLFTAAQVLDVLKKPQPVTP